jgi:predicted hydrolase (HD superfamily)
MAIKPIIDVQHRGKRVRVQFAPQNGIALKYDILVNDKPIKVSVFAEEVMRWLAREMCQEPNLRRQT